MPWHTFSASTANEYQRELLRRHLRSRMLEIDYRYFGDGQTPSAVSLTVHGDQLSERASTSSRTDLTDRIVTAATWAVEDAFQLLVIDTGEVPPSGSVASAGPPPLPAVHLTLVLHGLDRGQAEVALSAPDPELFRTALAAGETLPDVGHSVVAALCQDLRPLLRRDLLGPHFLA
jgi:hypothetical protein